MCCYIMEEFLFTDIVMGNAYKSNKKSKKVLDISHVCPTKPVQT